MRIGLDATALPPRPVGAGTYIIQLARALAELDSGCELVIFAQQHGRALIDLPAGPHLHWVTLPDRPPAARILWEQTIFPRLVREQRIDLLHSPHYTRPLRLPCASVVTIHDLTFFLFPELHTRFKRLYFPPMIRYSARKADALLAISESTRRDAMRILHIPPGKITTTPLGVSPAYHPVEDPALREEVRQRYKLPPAFILYVGIVEPRKNLPLLLQAYSLLRQQLADAPPLVIAGRQGWQVEAVFEQISALGLKDAVHFTGYVAGEDLPIVYNLAVEFVYPSIYEGFGLPPLEALACGTPVVTTAVSSMPEHIGQAGLLVPPQDAPALAQAMGAILTNESLRRTLAQRGPQRAAQFTWKRTAQITLQAYQRLLADRRPV